MVAALTEAVFACKCWVTTHKQLQFGIEFVCYVCGNTLCHQKQLVGYSCSQWLHMSNISQLKIPDRPKAYLYYSTPNKNVVAPNSFNNSGGLLKP